MTLSVLQRTLKLFCWHVRFCDFFDRARFAGSGTRFQLHLRIRYLGGHRSSHSRRYNCTLSVHQLVENSDFSFCLDNEALSDTSLYSSTKLKLAL